MKTVSRAIDLLECFSKERPTLSVGEIAAHLGIHKSIASRLGATLAARGLLEHDASTRRYGVGPRVQELGRLYSRESALESVAEPLLRQLAHAVGHASHVCVLDRMEMRTVSCVSSAHRLQVTVEVGGRRPVHATAAGKLFLAFGPEELFDVLSPDGRFARITPRTIESRLAMRREIAAIRKAGVAHNHEESAVGVGAVAAPIRASDGRILASLTTIFPLALVTTRDLPALARQVKLAADRISEGLCGASGEAASEEPATEAAAPRRAAR